MEFNTQIQELIKEFNTNSKANNMLYKDKAVREMFKTLYGIDRFTFVDRCNQISTELIPHITVYHGTKVIIKGRHDGEIINGIIEHLPTSIYEGRLLNNEVSFRSYLDGSEGIALWVNTGDKLTTHLYNAENIELVKD